MSAELALTKDAFVQIAKLESRVQKKVFDLVDKFRENPKSSALHYEPISDFKDDRARSVRVDQGYRAIIVSPRTGNRHLLVWVDNHDDAYRWARNKTFDVHPVTGSLQIVDATAAAAAVGTASGPPSTVARATFEGLFGHLADAELIDLGVPEPLIPSVRRVGDEKSLQRLAPHLPDEAAQALEWVGLLGGTVGDAKEFVLARPPPVSTEDFGPATETPEAQQRFVTIASGGDLQKMLQGPLALWRVFLHPDQRRLVDGSFNGSMRVLGGAGTGKTVVAMHRARHLADKVFTKPDEHILFTTFSKSLAQDVKLNLKTLYGGDVPARIEVTNLHSWAARFLKREGVEVGIVSDSEARSAWDDVVNRNGTDRFTKAFVVAEWNEVVQAQGIRSNEAYLRATRRGRGGPRLVKKDREFLWTLFESYRAVLDERHKVEFIDTIRLANERLKSRPGRLPYAAVVVDEAQDFGREDLKLIRALVPPGPNDLFFVGDAHQRIFALPVTMKDCGIEIRGRSRKLRVNYRTTHEIRRWATAVLEGVAVDDLDGNRDEMKGYTSVLNGPEPEVAWASSQKEEVAGLVRRVQELAAHDKGGGEGICIIASLGRLLDDVYAPALQDAGISTVRIDNSDELRAGPGVRLCTMHRAKGLEFQHVFVAGLGDDRFPRPTEEGLDDDPVATAHHDARQRSLLFVAATRARETLTISGWGTKRMPQ